MFECSSNSIISLVQFWTVSNYTWAEKIRIKLECLLIDCFWDSEDTYKFHYLTVQGRYNQIGIIHEYSCKEMLALSIHGSKK